MGPIAPIDGFLGAPSCHFDGFACQFGVIWGVFWKAVGARGMTLEVIGRTWGALRCLKTVPKRDPSGRGPGPMQHARWVAFPCFEGPLTSYQSLFAA